MLIMILGAGVLALAAGLLARAYLDARASAMSQLQAGVRIHQTIHGPIAYRDVGTGPAILILHGAGGGYDQGQLIAERFLEPDTRWIMPSRFGYPGSPLPPDASTRAQAEALVELLDRLAIDEVHVLAMSGGVPPALQLAALEPGRVTALALLSSAPFTPMTAEIQDLPIPAWAYQALFASDAPYWLMTQLARPSLAALFDASDTAERPMTPADRAFVDRMIDIFMPVGARRDGLENEGAAIDPDAVYMLDAIQAPVLIIHARDDGLTPVSVATHLAAALPQAHSVVYPSGGHLLLGHHEDVRRQLGEFFSPASR
ncbi:MAG: alpha/beta hydrolase [Oceanicaulis sp.]|nr:alpha/beta hydrolase [Oceanicaulis sp.]